MTYPEVVLNGPSLGEVTLQVISNRRAMVLEDAIVITRVQYNLEAHYFLEDGRWHYDSGNSMLKRRDNWLKPPTQVAQRRVRSLANEIDTLWKENDASLHAAAALAQRLWDANDLRADSVDIENKQEELKRLVVAFHHRVDYLVQQYPEFKNRQGPFPAEELFHHIQLEVDQHNVKGVA